MFRRINQVGIQLFKFIFGLSEVVCTGWGKNLTASYRKFNVINDKLHFWRIISCPNPIRRKPSFGSWGYLFYFYKYLRIFFVIAVQMGQRSYIPKKATIPPTNNKTQFSVLIPTPPSKRLLLIRSRRSNVVNDVWIRSPFIKELTIDS